MCKQMQERTRIECPENALNKKNISNANIYDDDGDPDSRRTEMRKSRERGGDGKNKKNTRIRNTKKMVF